MGYNDVEAGLLAVVRLLDGYTEVNTSQGDYRILAKGVEKAVILQPGPIVQRNVQSAPRRMRTLWVIDMELVVPFSGEISTIASNIRTFRQSLIDHVDKYPTLDSVANVVHALIVSGAEPESWQGESRKWWVQRLRVDVEERSTVTIAE